jgi:uncharacterized membrane protein
MDVPLGTRMARHMQRAIAQHVAVSYKLWEQLWHRENRDCGECGCEHLTRHRLQHKANLS